MIRLKQNKTRFVVIFAAISLILTGCSEVASPPNVPEKPDPILPTTGTLIIENDQGEIKDCTPELIIFAENADYMAFSGNGIQWTEWIDYQTSYSEFNLANNENGTEMSSGEKTIFVRFKDEAGNLSPEDDLAFDTVNYILGDLFTIIVEPSRIDLPAGESHAFTVRGFDKQLNEVPLEPEKVYWTKCCGVGNLNPTTGLTTVYTTPSVPGVRDITAHYQSLGVGAKINVLAKSGQN